MSARFRAVVRFCIHTLEGLSRWAGSTAVPRVTGPCSAFLRFSFTSTICSSRSTLWFSLSLHSSSLLFSFSSRPGRKLLSEKRERLWLWQTGDDHCSGKLLNLCPVMCNQLFSVVSHTHWIFLSSVLSCIPNAEKTICYSLLSTSSGSKEADYRIGEYNLMFSAVSYYSVFKSYIFGSVFLILR